MTVFYIYKPFTDVWLDEPAPEPTHYSELDLKSMKVQEMRDELLARNLSDKGVRNVIMARLAKALNTEKAEELKNKKKSKYNGSTNKINKDEVKMEVDTEKGKSAKATNQKKNVSKDKSGKDSTQESADDIDIELADIVVLDEYDSTKPTEEMSEKEKTQLIRHHTLPSAPQIIVHPNRKAKGGKFECAVKSLFVLLDYHPDDSKERFFEVSLFAEVFNDMLMRDFGFNIYKEMYRYKETEDTSNAPEVTEIKENSEKSDKIENKPKENDNEKEKSSKKDKIENKSKENDNEKEKSSKKDIKSGNEDKSGKSSNNDGLQLTKSESRKRKLSLSDSTVNGKDQELAASDKKMVVVKPELLLSFIFFDTTHCGYIFENDLEDLFSVLGLNLSRSQVKKLVAICKLSKYHAIHYRKLTDKEHTLESTPVIENVDDLTIEDLKMMAAGNNQYESIFGRNTDHNKISSMADDDVDGQGLINFKGTIVHVGKLLNQINRTEKNYSDLEKVHNDLLKQHSDLQKDHNKSTTKAKDLQAELKTVSRKLTDANQDFYSLNRKYRDQNSTLSYIYTRVAPYFVREKEKEKDAQSEGSRDKDKIDKEKEKEKSKDKESEKEKVKADKEKGKPKEDKEKDKPKEEKEKDKPKEEKDKDKPKEEKKNDEPKEETAEDTPKEENEKVKPKVETEKEIKDEDNKHKENTKTVNGEDVVKGEKEKQNERVDKEKANEKDDKEKEKVKHEKEQEEEKLKNEKEKVKEKVKFENRECKVIVKLIKDQPKNDKEKEKPKEEKQKPKANDKEKPIIKDIKMKPTATPKKVIEKPKAATPALKKIPISKPTGKVLKKSDNVAAKK